MPFAPRFQSERAPIHLQLPVIEFSCLCPFLDCFFFQDSIEASLATQFITADYCDEIIQVAMMAPSGSVGCDTLPACVAVSKCLQHRFPQNVVCYGATAAA